MVAGGSLQVGLRFVHVGGSRLYLRIWQQKPCALTPQLFPGTLTVVGIGLTPEPLQRVHVAKEEDWRPFNHNTILWFTVLIIGL